MILFTFLRIPIHIMRVISSNVQSYRTQSMQFGRKILL